ncbi:MAG: TIGR02996 domain-containing protein [Myxococcaceae bacterium]
MARRRPQPRIQQALDAWRATPTDDTAAHVDELSREVSKLSGPHDWDLFDFDSTRLRWVLEWLPGAAPGPRLAVLKQLNAQLRDPRLTSPLLALLTKNDLSPLDGALIITLLEDNADPRTPTLARTLGVESRWETLRRELDRWRRFVSERDAMLRGVLEHPDDRERRLVVADWLSDFGDPLGELMSLQLANAAPDRVEELRRANQSTWCSELFTPQPVREVWFEDGLPVGIAVPRPIGWHPSFNSVRGIAVVSGETPWLFGAPWTRISLVRPLPYFSANDADGHRDLLARLDEYIVDGRTRSIARLFKFRGRRFEFYSSQDTVPRWWKQVVPPGGEVTLIVPTTSDAKDEPGWKTTVQFLPAPQVELAMRTRSHDFEFSPLF